MEISLRAMREDEFEGYRAYFVADYAQEIMDNYGHSNVVALKMAQTAIETSFPKGITPENQALLSIDLLDPRDETALAEVVEHAQEELNADECEQNRSKSEQNTDNSERAQLAGYLWRMINEEDESCFISDFYIIPSMRSKGLGKLAIRALEEDMKALGIKQIKLRVAYQNNRAAELYKAMGFTITGINMSKLLV